MRLFGNIIWHFPFCGFISATITYLLGLLLVLTVVAAPIGLGLMELGKFLFWPYGRALVDKNRISPTESNALSKYSTLIWILYLPIGLLLSLLGIIQVIGSFLSFIGIPIGIVVAKSLGTYLKPINKVCISAKEADALERMEGDADLARRQGREIPTSSSTAPITPPPVLLPDNSPSSSASLRDRLAALPSGVKVAGAVVIALLVMTTLKSIFSSKKTAADAIEPVRATSAKAVPEKAPENFAPLTPANNPAPEPAKASTPLPLIPPPEPLKQPEVRAEKVEAIKAETPHPTAKPSAAKPAPVAKEKPKSAQQISHDEHNGQRERDKARLKDTNQQLDQLLKN